MVVADKTGILELGLWAEQIAEVETGKSYKITNLSTRDFNGQLKLTTTLNTRIEQIDDMTNTQTDAAALFAMEKQKSKVLQCTVVKTTKCSNCNSAIDMPIDQSQSPLIRCSHCHMKMKVSSLQHKLHAKLNFETENKDICKKTAFNETILHFLEQSNKEEICNDTEAIEDFLLESEHMIFHYKKNSDIIDKIEIPIASATRDSL